MAPPSIHPDTKTAYQWKTPLVPIEQLPELPQAWTERFLPIRKQMEPVKVDRSAPPSDKSQKRILAYLDKMEPAVQGSAGHSALLSVASFLVHGCRMSPTDAAAFAANHYNPRCVPPWDISNAADWKDFSRKFHEVQKLPHEKPEGWFIETTAF